MSLAFGKNLGARGRALSGIRGQHPNFRGVRDQHPSAHAPVVYHTPPATPAHRPVFNGPLGGHGPMAGGTVSLQPQSVSMSGGVRGGATGILIRNRPHNMPQRATYSGVYGDAASEAAAWMEYARANETPDQTFRRLQADASMGRKPTTEQLLGLGSQLLNIFGKKQVTPSPEVYAPTTPPPTTSSLPSWAAPVLAVGVLGAIGAVIYSVVK